MLTTPKRKEKDIEIMLEDVVEETENYQSTNLNELRGSK